MRFARYAWTLLVILWMVSVPSSAQELRLRSATPLPLEAAPGGVASALVEIENVGAVPRDVRLSAEMPADWSPLVPFARRQIESGATARLLISLQVPASTAAGLVHVRLSAGTDTLALPIQVAIRPGLSLEATRTPSPVQAGEAFEIEYAVSNRGNTSLEVTIAARSSLGYALDVDPPRLELARNESLPVLVRITTCADLSSRVTHGLIVTATAVPSLDEPVTVSTPTDMLPVGRRMVRRDDDVIPATLSLLATGEHGRAAGQVTAEVRDAEIGRTTVDALIRTPDIRRTSAFGGRDRYALTVVRPNTSIRAGDQVYASSLLLESGTSGFGLEAESRWRSVQAGGYALRTRHVFPQRTQGAAFVRWQAVPRLAITGHTLVKRDFESGEAASAVLEVRPGGGMQIEVEGAVGAFGSGTDHAWSAALVGSGERSTWSLRMRRTGADFLGSEQGTETLAATANLFAGPIFRFQVQGRAQRRSFDAVDAGRFQQLSGFGRAGAGIGLRTGNTRLTAMLFAGGRLLDDDRSGLRREERVLEMRAGVTSGWFSMNSAIRRGWTRDPFAGARTVDDAFTAADVSVNVTRGPLSTGLQGAVTTGPTFFLPFDQERLSGGLNLSWDRGGAFRATALVYRSVDRNLDRQEFTTADLIMTREFSSGWEVELRGRHVGTSAARSVRDATMGLTLRLPVALPNPISPHEELSGRVVDIETGKGVTGAVIRVGNRTVVTEADGRFATRRPDTPFYVSIDRASIGLSRIPAIEMPIFVGDADAASSTIDIPIVRSASLRIRLVSAADSSDASGRRTISRDLSSEEIGAVMINLEQITDSEMPGRRERRLIGEDREVILSDLPPGSWQLSAVGRSVPDGYRIDPPEQRIVLGPGTEASLSLELAAEKREIRIISGGAVKLGAAGRQESEHGGGRDAAGAESDDGASKAGEREAGAAVTHHTVRAGETLTRIARRYYGSTDYWARIHAANLDRIEDPDRIRVGQVLRIPGDKGPLTEEELRRVRRQGGRDL